MTHRVKTPLWLGGALLALALTGCETTKNVQVIAPPPVQTAAVLAVKLQTVGTDTLEARLSNWKACRAGTALWEEPDDGVVMFSCQGQPRGAYMFRWTVDANQHVTLKDITHIAQDDADFSGNSFVDEEANEIYQAALENRIVSGMEMD